MKYSQKVTFLELTSRQLPKHTKKTYFFSVGISNRRLSENKEHKNLCFSNHMSLHIINEQ